MKQIILVLIFLAACSTTVEMNDDMKDMTDEEYNTMMDDDPAEIDWQNIQITDVNTEEAFTIGQFDQPVFVESFAIWCPTCTRQQLEFKKLHETNNDFVSIALDTDPNEDIIKVKEHAEANGFDWRYAVSPADLTQGLINDFGLGVVNAPAVPVILICPGKEPELLGRGIKDQTDLTMALASCEA